MIVETQTYERVPFEVQAVQVTAENMAAIADWTQGELKNDDPKAKGKPDATPQYIQIDVHQPQTVRQTKAYIGDWVLLATASSGFKVYMNRAFRSSFRQVAGAPTVVHGAPKEVVEARQAVDEAKFNEWLATEGDVRVLKLVSETPDETASAPIPTPSLLALQEAFAKEQVPGSERG